MSKRKTERGFWVFDEGIPTRDGPVRVYESSLAGAGAHVWIGLGGASAGLCPYVLLLDVPSAKRVAAALLEFVRAAEADELTELAT